MGSVSWIEEHRLRFLLLEMSAIFILAHSITNNSGQSTQVVSAWLGVLSSSISPINLRNAGYERKRRITTLFCTMLRSKMAYLQDFKLLFWAFCWVSQLYCYQFLLLVEFLF